MLGSSEQVPEASDKAATFIFLASSSSSALELLLCRQVVRSHVSQTRSGLGISEVTSPPAIIPSVVRLPSSACDSSVVLFLIIETREVEGEVGDFTVATVERGGGTGEAGDSGEAGETGGAGEAGEAGEAREAR